jgi:dTDP-4-dehydrorhamnose 3,5-epimerase-like enzyme
LYKILNLPDFSDKRGNLIAIEGGIDIPFEIKRIYYMYGSDSNVIRGLHAHYKLRQVFIAMHGKCTIKLFDGEKEEIFELNNPKKGIYLDTMIWREVTDFSADCVLMVLASEHYDENDYIRDIDEFKKIVKSNR